MLANHGGPREPGEEPQASCERTLQRWPRSPTMPTGIGMAVWRATEGAAEGFKAFDAWSKKSAKYDAHVTAQKWAGYFKSPPTDIGAGTIFHLAAQADPTWREKQAQPNDAPPAQEHAELERLAKLSLLQYEQERKEAADRLDVRTSILDKLVAAKRIELGLGEGQDGKQGRAVEFPEPEPWPQPVSGPDLLDGIARAIRDHIVMSDTSRDTAALWGVHAYLIDCFLVSPRLGVRSPTKRCGKTTLLTV